jgi:hypothetical protein
MYVTTGRCYEGVAGLATSCCPLLRVKCNSPFTRLPTRNGLFDLKGANSLNWLPFTVPVISTEYPRVFNVPVNALPLCFRSRIDSCFSPFVKVWPEAAHLPLMVCPYAATATLSANAPISNWNKLIRSLARVRFPLLLVSIIITFLVVEGSPTGC